MTERNGKRGSDALGSVVIHAVDEEVHAAVVARQPELLGAPIRQQEEAEQERDGEDERHDRDDVLAAAVGRR